MAGLGTSEMLIIAVVVVLLFGSARLPKLARSLGEAQRELRQARAGDDPTAT
jgi:sec-independent protein translocase protein TatA